MIVAGNNMGEYQELLKMGVDDFLIRFKLFIEELETKK